MPSYFLRHNRPTPHHAARDIRAWMKQQRERERKLAAMDGSVPGTHVAELKGNSGLLRFFRLFRP